LVFLAGFSNLPINSAKVYDYLHRFGLGVQKVLHWFNLNLLKRENKRSQKGKKLPFSKITDQVGDMFLLAVV